MPTITTFLTFASQAEEAALFYTSIFAGSRIVKTHRHGEGAPVPEGTVMSVTFELLGRTYIALNGGPSFTFSPGFSMFVACETPAEVDFYWDRLTAEGTPVQCGWVTDKFGLSWQVVPNGLEELIAGPDREKSARAMQAMMGMVKIDLAALEAAYNGK